MSKQKESIDLHTLKNITDCTARTDMMADIFNSSDIPTELESDSKQLMWDLEKLLMKETKIWWDFTTLKKYVEFKMVPRGLRLKKIPTTIYNDSFLEKWNSILTTCSFKLIDLIISFEETELNVTRDEIKVAQDNLKKLKIGEEYKTLDEKINKNIADLQKSITEMKKSKFNRDSRDYQTNQVYTWNRNKGPTPRSILKRRRYFTPRTPDESYRNVNFGSTEADSSDGAVGGANYGRGQYKARPNENEGYDLLKQDMEDKIITRFQKTTQTCRKET